MNDELSKYTFDEIEIGLTKQFQITITETMVDDFAKLSGDFNPLHTDNEYAVSSGFHGRVCHGMLLGSFFSRLIGMYLPGKHALHFSQSLKFVNSSTINEYQATWTSVMASILSMLLSLPNERKDNSLTAILCGGQILTRSVQEQFEKRFKVPIFEGYGLTETTSFSCINNYPAESRMVGSIGKPLQINEMSILNENSQEVEENIEGEICIRGYNVANGYLGDAKTNHAFRNGWFHSGDYGTRDKDGNFYFHGRKDSLIIKGGENVYPAELENVLYKHPDIDECAVIGIPDELLGEDICAFVKIKDKAQLTKNDLEKFCKNKIASYKQPKKIIIINNLVDLNEIPKGPTKKVLYRKLKEYYRNSF